VRATMSATRTPDPILTLLLAAGLAGCAAHAQNQQAAPSPTNSPAAVVQQIQGADFQACLGNIKAMALREGVPDSVADQALSGLTPDQRVLDLDSRQPEFTLTLARYLANAISPERIAKGRQMLAQHRTLLQAVERDYGVQPHYLVAFWGLESGYGTFVGDFSVVRSVATLACRTRRAQFFAGETVQALRILASQHMQAVQMKGSWAGAMGNTQFMPSTFVRYGVDRDGDGRIDLWRSLPDVFASSANFLNKSGWQRGQDSHIEVSLPQGFPYDRVDLNEERTAREWRTLGVTQADGRPLPDFADRAAIAIPAGYRGPAFLMLPNFKTIMVWNRSVLYALSVGVLARQIAGGPGLVRDSPPDDQPISRDTAVDMQQRLIKLALYSEEADGLIGPKTRASLRAFQIRAGLVADGHPSPETLARLRAAAP
jgi:membrane-bound lytic murein transglycosylase B